MVNSWWKLVVPAILLSPQAAEPLRGDDSFFLNREGPMSAAVVSQDWPWQGAGSPPPQAMPGGYAAAAPNTVQSPQPWPAAAAGNEPMPVAGPAQAAPPNWQAPAQLPPVQPAMPGNLQNQPPSFVNQLPVQDPRGMPNPSFMGGTVYGRLLNKGRPLVKCHVVIVPMHEVDGANRFDEDRKALAALTDEDGVFHFGDVPAGGYKLTWLPAGQNQWIRRISMQPDVKVHNGEATKLKEIRVALQTIN